VRIGTTQEKTYMVTRRAYGFNIEKRGRGPAASKWLPVLQLIYPTEAESKAAEDAIRQAMKNLITVESPITSNRASSEIRDFTNCYAFAQTTAADHSAP
jgi:hypothetical protein